jgi:hypothetical protein
MRNWPLIVTLIVAFASIAYGIGQMISPEMYKEMSPPNLGYVFVPDDDDFIKSDHFLEISFIEMGPEKPESVTAWISRHTYSDPTPLAFEQVYFGGAPTGKWIALLPPLEEKGTRWFYYLDIKTSTGREFEIWKNMKWFERLFSGFKETKQFFWTTYEGSVTRELPFGKALLVTHIVLACGALLIMYHALYYLLTIFYQPTRFGFVKAYRSVFWGGLTFFIGTLVIGPPITWYTFGTGFMPWPTQGLTNLGDITDTKTVLLVVAYAALLLSFFKSYKVTLVRAIDASIMRKFAIWTLVSLLITVFVFLIPHSQFMQDR